MNKETFYQIDKLSRMRIWTIRVETTGSVHNIITENGLVDGQLDGAVTPIILGKGKKSAYEQACADAYTEIKAKLKNGYVSDITQAKNTGETATIMEPMKGYKYHPTGLFKDKSIRKDTYTLDGKMTPKGTINSKYTFRGRAIGIERKLDGFRYRIELQDEPIYYSSSGDIVPGFPHITAHIKTVYATNPDYYRGKILDGEMYNHKLKTEFGFNIIQQACSTRKNLTPDKIELRSQMQFHIFDTCMDVALKYRKDFILPFANGTDIINVQTYYVIANVTVIEEYMTKFLDEGYEGLMIRFLDMPYEYDRSYQLYKYKPEEDDEFEIVDFERSIQGETLGAFICKMSDGRTFRADTMDELGTDAMKQYIWNHKNEYLGKWVNVKFMEYTFDGKPRHPKARYLRKGKSLD